MNKIAFWLSDFDGVMEAFGLLNARQKMHDIECDFGGLWAHVCMSLLKRMMGDLCMEGGYLDEENDGFFLRIVVSLIDIFKR